MEEVDALILRSLQGIGWKRKGIDSVSSLEDLPPQDFFSATVVCVETLVEGYSVSRPFPSQTAALVRIAVDLCKKVKELGYREEVAYQQLIYPAVRENRKLLSWLISQLPNEEEGEEGVSSSSSQKVVQNFNSLRQQLWSPPFILYSQPTSLVKPSPSCVRYKEIRSVSTGTIIPFSVPRAPRAAQPIIEQYLKTEMKLITLHPYHRENLVGTLMETSLATISLKNDEEADWAANGVGQARNPWDYSTKKRKMLKDMCATVFNSDHVLSFDGGSLAQKRMLDKWDTYKKRAKRTEKGRFQRKLQMQYEDQFKKRKALSSQKEKEQANELQKADNKLDELSASLENKSHQMEEMKNMIHQRQREIRKEGSKTGSLREELMRTKRVHDLLDDPEDNIRQLQEIAGRSREALENLGIEWEKHRSLLVTQLREKREDIIVRSQTSGQKLADIKEMRKIIRTMNSKLKEKETQHTRLLTAYESLPHDLERSFFTDRIMSVLEQLKKQQREIDKILLETRGLEEEIAGLREKKEEQFGAAVAACEEFINGKPGKRAELSKQALKHICKMDELFGTLVDDVLNTGNHAGEKMRFKSRNERLAEKMDAIDLDKVINDLEEIIEINKTYMTPKQRKQREKERKKQQEKIERVNKLGVDPFPECAEDKERAYREYEERKEREVGEWKKNLSDTVEDHRFWLKEIEKTIKSDKFGSDSDEIREYVSVIEEKEQKYLKESRSHQEKVAFVWDIMPLQVTQSDKREARIVEKQAKELHHELIELIVWWKKQREIALDDMINLEERERELTRKIKEYKEAVSSYQKWVEEKENEAESALPDSFQSLLSGFSKLEENDTTVNKESSDRFKKLTDIWGFIEGTERGKNLEDNIKPPKLEELCSHLTKLFKERKEKYLKKLFSLFGEEVSNLWEKYRSFVSQLSERYQESDLEELDSQKISSLLSSWEKVKEGEEAKGKELLEAATSCYEKYIELKKGNDAVEEAKPVHFPKEVGEKKREIERVLESYEAALVKKKQFHDRVNLFARAEEQWKKYTDFVEQANTSLVVEKVEEMDLENTHKTLKLWPAKKNEIVAEEEKLSKALFTSLSTHEVNKEGWESLPALTICTTRGEVKEKQEEFNSILTAYDDALDTRKRFHERELCLRDIDTSWAELQKFVDELRQELDLDKLKEKEGKEIEMLFAKWIDGSYQMKGDNLKEKIIKSLDLYEEKKDEWIARAGPIEREFVGREEVEKKKEEGDNMIKAYDEAITLRKKEYDREKAFNSITDQWEKYQGFVMDLSSPDSLVELGSNEIDSLYNKWVSKSRELRASNGVFHKKLIHDVETFESNQSKWEVLQPLNDSVVEKEKVHETKKEAEQKIEEYGQALGRKKKLSDREHCVKEIDTKWAKFQEVLEAIPPVESVEQIDEEQIGGEVAQWMKKMKEIKGAVTRLHNELRVLVGRYETNINEWASLEPLDREIIGKEEVDAKKSLLEDYEKALLRRQRFHENNLEMKKITNKWVEYQDFVASLSSDLLAKAEPFALMSQAELDDLASDWQANQKREYQAKEKGIYNALISLMNKYPDEDLKAIGIESEAVEEKKKECERLMINYEASFKKKKLNNDRAKTVKDVTDQWEKYLKFVGDLPRVSSLDGLGEEELEKLRSSWSSSKGALRSQGLSLHRGLLTVRKFYQMKQAEWEVLGECDVVGMEEIELKKAEWQQLMLSYETALLSRKKLVDRAGSVLEIQQKWREYCEFIESLPNAEAVEMMDLEEATKLLEGWGKVKAQLQNKSSSHHRALVALAGAYLTKQAQWKGLEPVAEKVAGKEEIDKKKEEAEKIISTYEGALSGKKNQDQRKQYVADLSAQWASYQEHCLMIQATFSEDSLHDLTSEEIQEIHEGWAEEKSKHQSQEASIRRVLLGLIDKCEVAQGSNLLQGVVSKAEVEELQAKALEAIRSYERVLFQMQKANQRKRDLESAREAIQSYVAWTDEQLIATTKSLEDSAGLGLKAFTEIYDNLPAEDDKLKKTAIDKSRDVERKLSVLEIALDPETAKKEGLMPQKEKEEIMAKNGGEHERLEAALKVRRRKFVVLLKEVKIRCSKEEFRNGFLDYEQWAQEQADRLDQTDMSQESIKTLLNFKMVIREDNDNLYDESAKKIKFMETLWNDGEELGIQKDFSHRLDEVFVVEKVLQEAIKRRYASFLQLEKELHEEKIEILFTDYIDFVEKAHNDMTSSVVEIQLVEDLAGLMQIKKKADEQDLILKTDHKKQVEELQESAKILEREGFEELSQNENYNINESLALVHEAFERGVEIKIEQIQKAAKVFYVSLADRHQKLEKRIQELEALEAVRLWNEKTEKLKVWVPKIVEDWSDKNDFGKNKEECFEYEKVLEKEEKDLENEIGETLKELEKLWEKIDRVGHPPEVTFKMIEETINTVKEAMIKRRRRYNEEKYSYEKERIIEEFNAAFENYPKWVSRLQKSWETETFDCTGNMKKLQIQRDQIEGENKALMHKNDVTYDEIAALWEKLEIMDATLVVNGNIDQAKEYKKRGYDAAEARLERVNKAVDGGNEVIDYLKTLDEYIIWVDELIAREEAVWNRKKAAPFPHSGSIEPVMKKALEFVKNVDEENAAKVGPLIQRLVKLEEAGLKTGRDPVSHDMKMKTFTQSITDGWTYFYEKYQEFEKNDPETDKQRRAKWFSLSEEDESSSGGSSSGGKMGKPEGGGIAKPKAGGDISENIFIVHLQDDGKIDWAGFGIQPPYCQMLYEEEKVVNTLRVQIMQNLEARANPDSLPELKKMLKSCILIERKREKKELQEEISIEKIEKFLTEEKEDRKKGIVLKRRENIDRFQSYADYEGVLFFQQVTNYFNFHIRYTQMKLEPKKNLEVIVKVLDERNNNKPSPDFETKGVVSLQIIAPDDTEIILDNFVPTGEPGEVMLQTPLEKVGTYKGMVMFNQHKVQGQGYADIVVAERKKLFGIF